MKPKNAQRRGAPGKAQRSGAPSEAGRGAAPIKLWGGRFEKASAAEFERFSESFSFDRRLALAEIRGSRLHVAALEQTGVVSKDEAVALKQALLSLERELSDAGFRWPENTGAAPEDVHTWVAQELESRAGAIARKLQTGRSRNEQVSLDLRIYLLDQRRALTNALAQLIGALSDFAEQHAAVLIPGYTHLQRAQPISLGHHALAYAEMLLRDAARMRQAFERVAVFPLGSGALAGSVLKADRQALADDLGFTTISHNSLDAVSDRDFVAELLFVFSLTAVHLSRFAEDWILYSSSEFGFLIPGDEYASGSSLMPQKKNPDALELIRGKAGRQIGRLMQILTVLKALPLSYNRDLQEDKEALFDSLDTTLGCLRVATGVVRTTRVNVQRAAAVVEDAALLATDLADLLVESGVAFRDAHEIVGKIISRSLKQGRDFRQFSDAELKSFSPLLDGSKVRALNARASVARRSSVGGTAIERVVERAHEVRRLSEDKEFRK